MLKGGCLCGNIRYEIVCEPLAGVACHCRDYQYISGGGEANLVVVPRAAFTLISGQEQTYHSTVDSGMRVWRSFCSVCGTPLFSGSYGKPDVLFVRVGSLDDPSAFKRQIHIWTDSAPSWHLMERNLPKAGKNPPNL